jgi:hypothetical protein
MPSPRASRFPFLCAGLLLLVACGTEEPPRLADSGPRPAEIPRQQEQAVRAGGAALAATGRQSFEGPAAFRCVLHEERGLQVNFRTRDPEIPAVAVRIEDFQGTGPYRARLFVTGRSRTGALVTSTGGANVEVQERDLPDGSSFVLLSGSFEGDYTGAAGKGSIEGRFETCSYLARREDGPTTGINAGGIAGGP